MPPVIDAMLRILRTASPACHRRLRLGLALRVAERALAVAPIPLAYAWLAPALAGGDGSSLALAIWLALLLAGQLAASYLGQLNCFLGSYDLMLGYRERVIGHLGRLPLGALQGRSTGQVAGIVTDDVKRVEDIFTHLAAELVAAASVPALFLVVLAWMDWRLTLALAATLPPAVWAINAASRFFLAHGRQKQELFLDTAGLVVEFVTGLRTLRLFDRTGDWLERLDRRFAEIRSASLGVEAWGGGSIQLYRFCLELGLVSLLLAADGLAAEGSLSATGWLLFVLAAGKLLEPLLDAAAFLTELRGMALGEARVRGLLDQPPLPQGEGHLASGAHAVAFRDVGFRYGGEWVLRRLSFTAPAGSVTAIVGASGAGKSTLLHLLARFFDPQEGGIFIGGTDIRDIPADALYAHLGFVFQDVQLFDGTILDNVRIGRPDADDEAVMAACRSAFCEEFVRRLPQGYHTRIGENGQRLSGGERQRLSIARALLKDAPILLLDEATASVDPVAQWEIQRALSRLARGRTVIVVAHRLGTVRHADQILVLDGGAVAERGRHADLLARDGLYAAFWRAQMLE